VEIVIHYLRILFVALSFSLAAQNTVWQPSPGHTQVAIWRGAAPDAHPVPGPEVASSSGKEFLVAGNPVVGIDNVSRPTMTVYSPTVNNTGVAIVVFPGGGYQTLAIDLEGSEVCDWLTAHGITCVLLKYRVPHTGPLWDQACGCFTDTKSSMALVDAQRTMGLVRLHSAEWHINPHKIGVLGFSAGGHLVAAISTHWEKRLYPSVDAADRESCRPDFGVALYPGHLWIDKSKFELNPQIHVTSRTPPAFIVQAENDPVDSVNNSLVYYRALKNARVPAEMHLYAEGKHAFGLRPTSLPITHWPEWMQRWLVTIGMLSE
jgi:acetyl esterase/lipase